MPATATGRGAQVILDGDAQRAARGVHANTYQANALYLDSLGRSGAVADGSTPDGTTKTGATATDYITSPNSVLASSSMAADARVARTNNPRVNAVMTTPPAITVPTSNDATLTNQWNNTNANLFSVFNFYGGTPTDDGAGFTSFNSTTLVGQGRQPFAWRVEVVLDAVKAQYYLLCINPACQVRVIVNGQYASLTPVTPPSGFSFLTLDFTAAGGRAVRNVTIECTGGVHFYGIYVGPTATVGKPTGRVRRMMVVGDSFAAAGGAALVNNAFPQVLSDLLGVRDMWNNGVGSTGYLQDASGTQTTFRQRLPDAVNARPDILLVVGGHNDASFGVQAFRAEVTAYLRAARGLPELIAVPIIIGGINGGNGTATLAPFETAMAEAVAAFNDPLVFYFPEITNPEGAWFTGTGSTAALTGSGNCDIYISSDGIHPNDAGHAFLAGRLRDAITRTVLP